jgi:hypothetical protein
MLKVTGMKRKSTIVAVLGMHRSGTSCVTNALRQAGLFLGSQVTAPKVNPHAKVAVRSVHNMDGYYEAEEAVAINDAILEKSGGAWDRPPADLVFDFTDDDRIAKFLASLRTEPVAGWKDPRTLLTFPRWLPHLQDFRIVACLRHPLNVAGSLRVRQSMALETGLELWTAYNERLLEYLEANEDAVVINFDATPENLRDSLVTAAEQLSLPRPEAAAEGFNQFLRHHAKSTDLSDRYCRSVYETLLARAAKSGVVGRNVSYFRVASNCLTDDPVSSRRHTACHEKLPFGASAGTVISDGASLLTLTEPDYGAWSCEATDEPAAIGLDSLVQFTATLRKEVNQLAQVSTMQNEYIQLLWSVREQLPSLATVEQVAELRALLLEIRQNTGRKSFLSKLWSKGRNALRTGP